MISFTDIRALTDPKYTAAEPEPEIQIPASASQFLLPETEDNTDQFLTAFAGIEIDEPLHPLRPLQQLQLDPSIQDAVNADRFLEELPENVNPQDLIVNDLILPPLSPLEYEKIGINQSIPESRAPILAAAPDTVQQNLPLTISSINPAKIPTVPQPDQTAVNQLETIAKFSDTRQASHEGSNFPNSEIKRGPVDTASPAQIKFDAPVDEASVKLPQQNTENMMPTTVSSIGTKMAPIPTNIPSDIQIAPAIITAPTSVSPSAVQPETIQLASNNTAPAQQVAQALARVTQAQNKLVVRLDPPELGRVTIEFQFDTNRGVTAIVSAENADIGSQLRDRSEFFFKSLKSAGFGNIDLSFDTSENLTQNGGSFSHEDDPNAIEIYHADTMLLDLDIEGVLPQPHLTMSAENLDILL